MWLQRLCVDLLKQLLPFATYRPLYVNACITVTNRTAPPFYSLPVPDAHIGQVLQTHRAQTDTSAQWIIDASLPAF